MRGRPTHARRRRCCAQRRLLEPGHGRGQHRRPRGSAGGPAGGRGRGAQQGRTPRAVRAGGGLHRAPRRTVVAHARARSADRLHRHHDRGAPASSRPRHRELTAYRQDADAPVDHRTAEFLGVALGTALLQDPALGLTDDLLAEARSARAEVHQATGMVISQVGVRPEDAMALLRGQAFANGTTLLDVARQIVQRHINFRDFTIEGD
ncbi:MAG: ANTAR domain-containing protein [Actinomycetales bacterium]|nr:MAG: ANTAR domain-containing protein [Actinomycetales bacterium]